MMKKRFVALSLQEEDAKIELQDIALALQSTQQVLYTSYMRGASENFCKSLNKTIRLLQDRQKEVEEIILHTNQLLNKD